METIYKYYKNSNTGDVIKSQTFIIGRISGIPVYWYRGKEFLGENLELPKGYIEISEKKYNREIKHIIKNNENKDNNM